MKARPAAEAAAAPDALADKARIATRASADYLLRSMLLLGEMVDGEFLTGLIWLAIVQANIGHIDQSGQGRRFGDGNAPPPDSLRRPVSVLALSASLGVAYETVRRHVAKLAAAGLCIRTKGGVVVPSAVLSSDKHAELMGRNLTNLRRLSRGLKAAGVKLD